MDFRKGSKGAGGGLSRNLYCRFWTCIQGFKQGFLGGKLQYKFRKMFVCGEGSKAIWNFSENSSVLVPSIEVAIGCTANCRGSTQFYGDDQLMTAINSSTL